MVQLQLKMRMIDLPLESIAVNYTIYISSFSIIFGKHNNIVKDDN